MKVAFQVFPVATVSTLEVSSTLVTPAAGGVPPSSLRTPPGPETCSASMALYPAATSPRVVVFLFVASGIHKY